MARLGERQSERLHRLMEPAGAQTVEQNHRGKVERLLQGLGDRYRAGVGTVEIARHIIAETGLTILQTGAGMDQTLVDGYGVNEGLQRRTGGSQSRHHIDLSLRRGKPRTTDPGPDPPLRQVGY